MIALALTLSLSAFQLDALEAAGRAAEPYGLAETFQAIVLQESSLCRSKVGTHGELGCAQLKLATAQEVDPDATAHRLLHDDAYNLRIGAAVLDRCLHRFRSLPRAVVCYNQGRGAVAIDGEGGYTTEQAKRHPYYLKIQQRRAEIRVMQE